MPTDDCGFSPRSIDVKSKHGSSDAACNFVFQKITPRVEDVKMAFNKLGVFP